LFFLEKTTTNNQTLSVPFPPSSPFQISETLNYDTIQSISESGHSRIPIFEDDADHIVGLLLVRDLAFLNPEDETPVRTILEYYGRQIKKVFFDTGLDEMLSSFREGKAHMAVVWKVKESSEGSDPIPQNLGIVTLEDVIEEIIQMEIDDETDVIGQCCSPAFRRPPMF